MDFREYTVARDGPELLILGTIHEPVHWDFSIRLCEDDLPGITRVLLRRRMLGWLLRAVFRRDRHAHWSQDARRTSRGQRPPAGRRRQALRIRAARDRGHAQPRGRTG